ncbi:hypothetical protein [Microbacterium sp. NPDC057944]|uniref:hypothetical protein n=1 Tax=Microbacterium sp. NPDC057944 TaxID=3346286 RepID=UPI0036DB380F
MNRNPNDPDASSAGARLVLFDSADPALTAGRRERRSRILAMRPTDTALHPLVERARSFPPLGAHWEYLRRDGVSLLVRARDSADAEDARWDATRIFSAISELQVVYVRDQRLGHLGWWLANDREPVIVSPRIWLGSQRTGLQAHVKLALGSLAEPKVWGEYSAVPRD